MIETLDRQRNGAGQDAVLTRRGRLTTRDLEIVAWLGRVRFASLEQLGRRFSLGRSQRFHRIGLLGDLGFVERHPQLFGIGPPLVLATGKGLSAANTMLALREPGVLSPADLAPGFVDARSFTHDSELVDLCIDYEQAGARVLCERELVSLAKRAETEPGRYALELGPSDDRQLHFPDLLIEEDGSRTAIELEIAEKTKTRLREILRGYGRARLIDRVLYLCPRPVVKTRVQKLAKELGIDDVVEVRSHERRPA